MRWMMMFMARTYLHELKNENTFSNLHHNSNCIMNTTMKYIIEEEWEATDIIEHLTKNNDEWQQLAYDVIDSLSPDEFFSNVVFCSTHSMQKNLKAIGLDHLIPDTYDTTFIKLFNRDIKIVLCKELSSLPYPYFIKSVGNDKEVDGTVVNNENDLNDVWEVNYVMQTDNMKFYVSSCVVFDVEHRLLVGNNKVYGCGYQRGNDKLIVPDEFISEIIKCSKGNFYCVDVGYINGIGWSIVEINPPFSLDSFDISVDNYVAYGRDFWLNVKKLID